MPSPFMQHWLRLQALIWLPCLGLHGFGVTAVAWAFWSIGIGVSFVGLAAILRAPRTAADLVTIARLLLLLVVASSAPAPLPVMAWLAILALVLLDLVDGAVARRFGGTEQGAILDMEADQFTVLLLALLVVEGGGPALVLLLPAMRWVFVLAMWALCLPAHDPKPVAGDNRRGRRCFAVVVGALLGSLWPTMPAAAVDGFAAIAVLVLGFSFSSDARFLISGLRAARSAP